MNGSAGPLLSVPDAETLARWFLYHMTMEQRAALIAEMPLVYARVFPGVDMASILAAVRQGILSVRSAQRERFCAAASETAAQLEEER